MVGKLQPHLLGKGNNGMFAGGIGPQRQIFAGRDFASPRSVVDDAAASALLYHLSRRGLGAEQYALGVYIHQGIPRLFVGFQQGRDRAHAGVIHEDAQATQLIAGLADHPLHLFFAGHVHLVRQGLAAKLPNFGSDLCGRPAVEVGNRHQAALLRQTQGYRPADASPGPGDDGYLAVKIITRHWLPPAGFPDHLLHQCSPSLVSYGTCISSRM